MNKKHQKDMTFARDVEITVRVPYMPAFLDTVYFRHALEEVTSSRCFTICHYRLSEREDKSSVINVLEQVEQDDLIASYQFYFQ